MRLGARQPRNPRGTARGHVRPTPAPSVAAGGDSGATPPAFAPGAPRAPGRPPPPPPGVEQQGKQESGGRSSSWFYLS